MRRLISSPRREHSRKPDELYGRIQRLVAGPYLELFCRTGAPNWDAWGDEVGKFSPETLCTQRFGLEEGQPNDLSVE